MSNGVTGPSKADQQKWQAEDDLRTLQRAQEVISDGKRVKAAQRVASEQIAALQKAKVLRPSGKEQAAARAKVAKKAVAGQGARKDAPKPAPRKRSK